MRGLNEWTRSLALRNILLVVCTRVPLLIQFAYFVAISASTAFAARLQTFRREKPLICTGSEGYEVRDLAASRFFNEPVCLESAE